MIGSKIGITLCKYLELRLLSSTGDAVGHTGSTDEAVRVDNDAALLMRVVHNEAAPVIIVVSIHLHHITRTDVHIQPGNISFPIFELECIHVSIDTYQSSLK